LAEVLKIVLEEIKDNTTAVIPPKASYALLNVELNPGVSDILATLNDEDVKFRIMPEPPYYIEVAKILFLWAKNKRVPLSFQSQHLLQDDIFKTTLERLENFTEKLIQILTDWIKASLEERKILVLQILEYLRVRGILTLLRVRQTIGSIDEFPPGPRTLIASFNRPFTAGVPLSTGARALSKHSHRSTEGWWGNVKGNDAQKNENADKVINKLLLDASWINVHQLPHDVYVFEIRTNEGYGARWTADGNFFRGFVEPMMEDGHEKGWVH